MFGHAAFGPSGSVFSKLPSKGPHSHPDGNVDAVQAEDLFLGHSREANTYISGTAGGKEVERAQWLAAQSRTTCVFSY